MQYLRYASVFAALFVLCQSKAVTHNLTHSKPSCDDKEKAYTLLDVANDFVNKAKNLYPDCTDDDFQCGRKERSLAFLEVASNLINGIKKTFPTCSECPKAPQKVPMDCSEILQRVKGTSGIYTIWPRGHEATDKGLSVYCDMDTDGGGWTVIQRRGKFSTPKDYFYKDWNSYKLGFGNLKEEFWLGNVNIHTISNQANYTIRLDFKAATGNTGYAEYETFWIEDELSQYALHISGYNGSAGIGDSLNYHNNMKFSTMDRDNDDDASRSCAVEYTGAWWHNKCLSSNLNGFYQPGVDSWKGIIWKTWLNSISLARVEMKLRPQRI